MGGKAGGQNTVTAQRRFDRTRATLLVAAFTPGMLSACTGGDMMSGLDGSLIPPASIGSGGGTYGSPSMNAVGSGNEVPGAYGGISAPTPPYPVSKLPDGYQPQNTSYQTQAQQDSGYQQNGTFNQDGGYLQAAPSSSGIQSAPLLAPPSQSPPQAQPSESYSQPDPSFSNDSEIAPPQQASTPVPQANAPTEPPTQTAALGQPSSEVQFLPLVGAPNEQANLLAQALADEAARSSVTIRPAADGQAAVRLKGYFSAFDEGEQSVLVYVWDVLDQNDERIHRIQGQERFSKAADSPWAGVDRAVLDRVARATLQEAQGLPPA
ncbi:hypothetical protein FP2506_03209 [Fulvimarina pelagi HTCC2506]|uniref:Lipoprotein n=2 Tax=Fulvimarina pelagi TaxID=217511 RepID=Q0G091_9HYPH|nr:hypothetical protein [Fulvimarina pelagi]EAU40702.1 hypothetical protein FP2506_03209 [Fulvimarina pelagi HTCC2506]BAT31245.1 hypothetical protein [Fulvimarina pelagi]